MIAYLTDVVSGNYFDGQARMRADFNTESTADTVFFNYWPINIGKVEIDCFVTEWADRGTGPANSTVYPGVASRAVDLGVDLHLL